MVGIGGLPKQQPSNPEEMEDDFKEVINLCASTDQDSSKIDIRWWWWCIVQGSIYNGLFVLTEQHKLYVALLAYNIMMSDD